MFPTIPCIPAIHGGQMQELEQRRERLPTTAGMQELEQRRERLPTTAGLRAARVVGIHIVVDDLPKLRSNILTA